MKLCGIKNVLTSQTTVPKVLKGKNNRCSQAQPIIKDLFEIVRPLKVYFADLPYQLLKLQDKDIINANSWLRKYYLTDENRGFIAVGIWSNMPVKRWDINNYIEVLQKLILKFDIIPIFFGSKNEHEKASFIKNIIGKGINGCGQLSIHEGIAIMKKCKLYLGNDTGIMHMADVAGIPSVAIFSSIDMPGRWDPIHPKSVVLRKSLDCEGCLLRECHHNNMKCINSISIDEVFNSVVKILKNITVEVPESLDKFEL